VAATLAQVTPGAVNKGNTDVTLRLSGLTVSPRSRSFDVYRTTYGSTQPTFISSFNVLKGVSAVNFTADFGAAPDHLDSENQKFYIRGIADDGTVIAGQIGPIDFTN
jgi:hypothetical protein